MYRSVFYGSYCAISLIMLCYAPSYYSHSYCLALMIIHLCYALPFLHNRIKASSFLNFDVLFLFSYFCINYLHPVFVYPDDEFLPAFAFKYNSKVISYALALASVGISFYIFGNVLMQKRKEVKSARKFQVDSLIVYATENIALVCSCILFIYVIITTIGRFQHLYPRLMFLLVAIISLAFFYKASHLCGIIPNRNRLAFFCINNRKNLLSLLLFCVSLLMIGSRGNVIVIALIVLFIINHFYVKLKARYIIPLGVLAILVMSILMLTRGSEQMIGRVPLVQTLEYGFKVIIESENALWLPFLDFIVNARTLYESVDYVKVYDCLYGASYLKVFFVFIPGGATFFIKNYLNKNITDLETGTIFTDFANAPYGLGTNMIADLYVNFHVIGVIIGTFLLGILVAYSQQKQSKYRLLLYMSLFGNAIYFPRAYIFIWVDLFVLLFLFNLLIESIFKFKKTKLCH